MFYILRLPYKRKVKLCLCWLTSFILQKINCKNQTSPNRSCVLDNRRTSSIYCCDLVETTCCIVLYSSKKRPVAFWKQLVSRDLATTTFYQSCRSLDCGKDNLWEDGARCYVNLAQIFGANRLILEICSLTTCSMRRHLTRTEVPFIST